MNLNTSNNYDDSSLLKENEINKKTINNEELDEDEELCFGKVCLKSSKCNFKSKNDNIICFLSTCMISSLLIALIFPIIIYKLVDSLIDDEVVIDSFNSPSYSDWQTNINGDIDIHYEVYFFNVQNENEILTGAKPIVVELGPYSFNEYFYKFDIDFSSDGTEVTYNNQKFYTFNPDRSGPGLSIDDQLTLPYVSVVALDYFLGTIPIATEEMVEYLIISKLDDAYNKTMTKLIVAYDTVSAKILPPKKKQQLLNEITHVKYDTEVIYQELLAFVAVSDPALLLWKLLLCPVGLTPFWKTTPIPAYFGWLNDTVFTEIQNVINGLGLEDIVPWTTSVTGASTNYSTVADRKRRVGPDTMKTGKKNTKEVSQYVTWGGMKLIYGCTNPMANSTVYNKETEFPSCQHFQTDWTHEYAMSQGYTLGWATEYANRVQGTNGDMFGRPVTSDLEQVFIGDVYRGFFFEFTGIVDDWEGIELRRYELRDKDLLNAYNNPANAQYFSYGPDGILNLTQVTGAPSYASLPHFYKADPALVAAISGLDPVGSSHGSYLDIEPQTGLLTRAKKSLQANWKMNSIDFPLSSPTIIPQVENLCSNITNISIELYNLNITNETFECPLWILIPTLECTSQPANWTLQNDEIYFPYAWTNEAFTSGSDVADALNDSIFLITSISVNIQFWGLILATICFFCIVTLQYYDNNNVISISKKEIFPYEGNLKEPLLSLNS